MGLIQPAVQGIIARKLKPAALLPGDGRNTRSELPIRNAVNIVRALLVVRIVVIVSH